MYRFVSYLINYPELKCEHNLKFWMWLKEQDNIFHEVCCHMWRIYAGFSHPKSSSDFSLNIRNNKFNLGFKCCMLNIHSSDHFLMLSIYCSKLYTFNCNIYAMSHLANFNWCYFFSIESFGRYSSTFYPLTLSLFLCLFIFFLSQQVMFTFWC